MTQTTARCLILACGNTLRSDDGVGPWLAAWAENKFCEDPALRVLSRQQWTPDLAEEIAQAESVLFIDCSIESAPGSIRIQEVYPSDPTQGVATHHQGAPELLALARELYDTLPKTAQLLTIGAGSTELGEVFSDPVRTSLPEACRLLEETIVSFLYNP
jgi:hydrogenase maturation protease